MALSGDAEGDTMTLVSTRSSPHDLETDQRVTLHGVTWEQYETVMAIRGESSGVRLTYLKGELELMSPSRPHEGIKTCIARLLETWAFENDVDLDGFGSWAIKQRLRERGAEPDECYTRGPGHNEERPDIAIEVVWTSRGIDKLEVYRGLDVPEVWFWQDGRLETWHLVGERYEQRERSAVLPELDVQQLAAFVAPRGHTAAQRRYLQALRGRPA